MTAVVPPARTSTETTPVGGTDARPATGGPEGRPAARVSQPAPAPPAGPEISLSLIPAPAGQPDERHLLPNVLLAGVTHAGAGRLARALARHPEVTLPVVERVDHYSPLRFDQPVRDSLADYDQRYENWRGQRYRLERSPIYFDGGPRLVEAVAGDLPDLRVLLLLRNPAQRLWAAYRDKVARGRLPEALSFQTYVERCMILRASGTERYEGNRYFRSLSSGLYVDHIEPWLEAFGPRVRVLFTEHLIADPDRTVREVFGWLDLDPRAVQRHRSQRGAAVIDGGEPSRLQSYGTAGRRPWSSLHAPVDLVRRVAGPRVPRQSDRVRQRLEEVYARSNRELATVLTSAGYHRVPGWLRRG